MHLNQLVLQAYQLMLLDFVKEELAIILHNIVPELSSAVDLSSNFTLLPIASFLLLMVSARVTLALFIHTTNTGGHCL